MELSTGIFSILLLAAVNLYYPESGNKNVQPRSTPESDVVPQYDFVIVGAGSAGCVVANRLSENLNWTVLLLEAGGDEDYFSDVPRMNRYLRNTEKNWNYTTVEQKRACLGLNGICNYPRGRVMGGSSTVNAMMYVRGNKADYDEWAAAGNTGWSYREVLPYFVKSENNTIPSMFSSFHGYEGYLNVGHSRYLSPLATKYIQAGTEFGWKEGDYNGENQETIGILQNTMDGPSRESASKAYLNPIRSRNNLHIMKNARVTKLLIDKNVAKGVEYYKDNEKHTVLAKKEVVVSAGAIDTPKLLLLSGIGPKKELVKHNIPQFADLPVGKYLKDHLMLPIDFQLEETEGFSISEWKTAESIVEYAVSKEGPLTSTGAEAMTFLNVINKTEPPNLQMIFFSEPGSNKTNNKPIISVVLSNVYPKSVGTVKLKSGDYTEPPLIDPNYFHEEVDFEVFQKGFELLLEFMETPTMSSLSPKLYTEKYTTCPSSKYLSKEEYMKCIIENYTATIYHPVSTTKMGPWDSEESVVTPELLVKGFLNLRVIDASVMHDIVRGNTNAPTIMIAEKGSDIIKAHNE